MSRRSGQSGCIQKDGKWFIVRFWKDVEGQEERKLMREKICPISGPGKLSASARERKAKEIIAASGVDTAAHFEKVVKSVHGVTFREQAISWLDKVRNRKRKPVAPSTIATWESALENWLNPNIGDMPLESIDNLEVKKLVETMHESGKLGPSAIRAYTNVVKMVVASAVDERGTKIHPREWNHEFIDMPRVRPLKQLTFTPEVVTGIVAKAKKPKYRMLFALCASTGLRFGEALGIDIKNISPDFTTIVIDRKAWRGEVQGFLKTTNGKREVDLHSSVAEMLKKFVGEKKSGLLFSTKGGKPLHQSNILRRTLHPILAELQQPRTGFHAFRRFRVTHLRFQCAPEDLIRFWVGHANASITDSYSKLQSDVAFRKEVVERVGIGFKLSEKITPIVPNVPKCSETTDVHLAASA